MENNPHIIALKDAYFTAYILGSIITILPVDRIGILQPDASGVTYNWDVDAKVELIDPIGNATTIFSGKPSKDNPIDYTLSMNGTYSLRYTGSTYMRNSNIVTTHTYNFTYYIVVAINYDPKPKWNIRTVLERLLRVYDTRMITDTQGVQYKLDAEQAADFEKILAPEFAFTNKTLKEALDIVGDYIHGVPRLVKGESGKLDTIRYDMLGGTKRAKLADPKYPYISKFKSRSVEDYATMLDSTVENLVNTIDAKEGSMTDPFRGGWRSTRADEAYVRITDGNMIALTAKPIQKIEKVECFIDGKVGDITPYVFEAAEYGRLSSFAGAFPLAKAWALYYEKGQPNIRGLNFKPPTVYSGSSSSNYAITNIIKAVMGIDISASAWDDGKYTELAFRITYTPIFSTRIKVRKSLVKPNEPQSTLFYNQGSNLVETRYYGENVKGAIARMGNIEEVRTYLLKSLGLIPRVGELWGDDMYVSSVSCAHYGDYTECTVALTKDYNRLSQYIGINSEWRAYEVSERTAYDRTSVYVDYAVIGATENGPYTLTSESANTAQYIKGCFTTTGAPKPITAAVVFSLDENLNTIATNTLPIISTAFGDVLSFQFGMADNYSAGSKSVYADNSSVGGYWQTDSPYVDYYGDVYAIGLRLCLGGERGESGPYVLPQGNWGSNAVFYTPTDSPLRIEKNGGEIMSLNYELQFVTTIPELVIGSALARRCPLVGAVNENSTRLYVLPDRVGKFDNTIDLTKATELAWRPLPNGDGNGAVSFENATATVDGQSWAIADEATGEMLIAMNKSVKAGDTIEVPPISFKHYL